MSRIGVQPVAVPAGVTVDISGNKLSAKGAKGELSMEIPSLITVKQEDDAGSSVLKVTRANETKNAKSLHGLTRSLIHNMLTGVSEGYSKQLEINGVGFRASVSGRAVTLNLGFSHDVAYTLPEGVDASVEQNIITISGLDKQAVGHVAAEIRALRKPEPYKGKGIRYVGEYIIRKAGKAAAGGKE